MKCVLCPGFVRSHDLCEPRHEVVLCRDQDRSCPLGENLLIRQAERVAHGFPAEARVTALNQPVFA